MTLEAAQAIDLDELVQLYESGESVLALAKRFSVDRNTITKRLRLMGIEPRGMRDAQLLLSSRRTPQERRRLAEFAFEAKRGRPNSDEALERAARTRESLGYGGSMGELVLAKWLARRGLRMKPQVAIGRYNCDLALAPVAVEVFGGNWHASGYHARAYPERCKEILHAGWNLVIVWDQARCPLSIEAAQYVVAFYEVARAYPAPVGEYRVIRGDGEELSRGRGELDDDALVPSQRKRLRD